MTLSKGILQIVIALVLGLVATFFIHAFITARTKTASPKTIPVVVADADIKPGFALRPEALRLVQWPEAIFIPESASAVKDVTGRVALVPINKGEPVLLSKLAPEGAAAGLGGLLRSDKLAVTIRTDDVTGVAGFLHPGERVDVLVDMKMPDSDEHISKIILQGIGVLTAGQKWEQTADKKPQIVNTVTLELSPAEAEIINLASKQGRIHLALRSQQNKNTVATSGVSTSELLQGRKLPAAQVQFAAQPPDLPRRGVCPPRTVQVIKGTNVTEKSFD